MGRYSDRASYDSHPGTGDRREEVAAGAVPLRTDNKNVALGRKREDSAVTLFRLTLQLGIDTVYPFLNVTTGHHRCRCARRRSRSDLKPEMDLELRRASAYGLVFTSPVNHQGYLLGHQLRVWLGHQLRDVEFDIDDTPFPTVVDHRG